MAHGALHPRGDPARHPRGRPAAGVRVGVRAPAPAFAGPLDRRRGALETVAAAGLDHVVVHDHVSFRGGAGWDGLLRATALAMLHPELPVHVGVYLLPLRHPVPVARQLAELAELAPGRVVLGVGIGGEDRAEVAACGVDPRTRGRRTDEALPLLRALLTGEPVTHRGEFFAVDGLAVRPPADPPIPIVVGGRSDAALTRAGRLGDGWVGIWVSPRRYAEAVARCGAVAQAAGRDAPARHSLQVWCGLADDRETARKHLAAAMEDLYRMPFDAFERYTPYGTPEDVAAGLAPYVEAGCTTFSLLAEGPSPEETVAAAGEVRRLLGR